MKKSIVRAFSLLIALMLILGSAPITGLLTPASALGVVVDGVAKNDSETGSPIIPVNPSDYIWVLYSDGKLYINELPDTPGWLDNSSLVVNATIGENVTEIGQKWFYGCKNLTTISLPNSLYAVNDHAFDGCAKLTSVTLPTFTNSLGDYAFYGCTGLTSVNLGASITSVGENVFKGCTSLEKVTLLNGCTTIGYGMFCDCSKLTEISLPDSITAIDSHAFDNCSALTSVVIPDSVLSVGDYAFYGCSSIGSVSIGHKLSIVGAYVFGRCTSLSSVTIKSGSDCIGDWMFYNCTSLTSIPNLPESISAIGSHAFEGCSALTSIVLPNTATSVGDNAFYGCSKLSSVTLDSALNVIGKLAFYGSAITDISIPANVTKIGSGAFSSCSKLVNIVVTGTNPAYRSKNGILYNAELTELLSCPAGKTGELIIPGTCVSIDSYAFNDCAGVTEITIPKSVNAIDATAFNGCSENLIITADCDSLAASYAKTYDITFNPIHTATPEWNITKEPGCETLGEKQEICPACGTVFQTAPVDALEHDYKATVTKAATCEENGIYTFVCSRNAAHSYTEVIPMTGHNMDAGVVTKEATCTEDGVLTYSCTNPDCTKKIYEVIEKLGHNYDNGTVTKEATCEADGVMTFTCRNNARHTYTEVIPMTGHDYDNGAVTKAATCTEDGVMTYTCKNDAKHTRTEPIPMTGHKYDKGVVTTPATCTEDGVMTFTCTNPGCEDSYTEVITKTGHHFDYDNGEVTKKNVCVDGEITYTCKDCDVTEVAILPAQHYVHSYWTVDVEPTCTAPGEKSHHCGVCQQRVDVTAISATGHSFVNGICTKCQAWDGVTAALKTPSLTSIRSFSKGIIFTWDAIDGATGFKVYRKVAGGSWKCIAVVDDGTAVSYIDTNVKNGVAYTYTLKAFNSSYTSGYDKDGVSYTFLITPKLVSAKNAGKGVVVTWSVNSEADGYYIYRKTVGSWTLIKKVTGTSVSSYTDTSAKSGQTYTYTVRAYNDGSLSSYYTGINSKFLSAPSLTKAVAYSKGIQVRWGAVDGAGSYYVYRKTAGSGWARIAVVNSSKLAYNDTTAVKGVKYTYTVRAVSGSFASSYYSGISATR